MACEIIIKDLNGFLNINKMSEFKLDLIEYSNSFELNVIGQKIVYNLDEAISASEWAKEPVKNLRTFDFPCLSSGIKIREKNTRGRNIKNALGFFNNCANKVEKNAQECSLFTTSYGNGHGLSVNNFTRCTSLFAARKLVEKTWVNSKDEYMKPNTEHPLWQEFENDSIVYSLFNTSSNQSSLRQVEYKGKLWDIKNEFFWMSREEIMSLANENGNDACYQDANVSTDRYVYNLLQNITLSEEAQLVLDKACELVRKTFKYRMMFDEDNENYQINNWDASYYQMKPLWKEYAKDDFEEFKSLYKKLGDKMRPMVYELGFLRK
jgi:hypothetical protein